VFNLWVSIIEWLNEFMDLNLVANPKLYLLAMADDTGLDTPDIFWLCWLNNTYGSVEMMLNPSR